MLDLAVTCGGTFNLIGLCQLSSKPRGRSARSCAESPRIGSRKTVPSMVSVQRIYATPRSQLRGVGVLPVFCLPP